MTEITTRCPGCSISLRASQAHLLAANGQVQCGACRLIFDAHTHQIEEELPTESDSAQNISLDNDDLLIYDDMDLSALDTYEQNEAFTLDETTLADAQSDDDTNALELAQDLVATDISLREPIQQDLLTATINNAAHQLTDDPHVKTETSLLEPDEATIPDALLTRPELPQRNYLKMARWPALSALAILMLIFQYIYFHADILGTDPTHRPWLAHFCDIATCKLPIMRDTTQIRSSQLLVHSHPDIPGALIVDAVIINEANFDQPFPGLALNFEDLQGVSIAHRKFRPDEYLHGELTGATIMPVNQPVRLTLELLDPGPKAINYSLFISE